MSRACVPFTHSRSECPLAAAPMRRTMAAWGWSDPVTAVPGTAGQEDNLPFTALPVLTGLVESGGPHS
jgi:hypothetical protein